MQNPEAVAIGRAEGLVLYKATVLLQIPLLMWLTLKYYSSHANLAQISSREEALEKFQHLSNVTANDRGIFPWVRSVWLLKIETR